MDRYARSWMFFLQTNVCASERTPHAPSLMLQVAGRGYAELLRKPIRRSSVAFIRHSSEVYRKRPLQHHLALPRSATSILDAFRRLFEHLHVACAPPYARDRQCSAGGSA